MDVAFVLGVGTKVLEVGKRFEGAGGELGERVFLVGILLWSFGEVSAKEKGLKLRAEVGEDGR